MVPRCLPANENSSCPNSSCMAKSLNKDDIDPAITYQSTKPHEESM